MIFKESGLIEYPTVIFIHGGCLSDWSLIPIVKGFEKNFHVVTVIIDGHRDAS